MLTAEQHAEFDERGFVRLPGVFSRSEADAMEERVWTTLERKHAVRRGDPTSWQIPLASGLQSLRTHAVFEPIGGPVLHGALDELIGAGCWQMPKHWGQFLATFPVTECGANRSRAIWHTDFPYFLPDDRVIGALVFSFVGAVPAGTGGTLVIAGSHKVVGRFIGANPRLRSAKMKVARRALMSSDPWLKALRDESENWGWNGEFDAREHSIGGIPVAVTELTGEPGDVVIGHPWLVHTPSPNRGDRPRLMRVQRIRPAAPPAAE